MTHHGKIDSYGSTKGAGTIAPEKRGGEPHAIGQGWPLDPGGEFPSWT